jgi:NADH-quinone oxidoreductase subunit L
MPQTFWPFLIGGLALAGAPPLAGFFSKDEIMTAAFSTNWPAAVMLLLAAGMTAFYVGRQLLLVFWGAPRSEAAAGAMESGRLMTWPLLALAGLTVLGGLINLPRLHTLGHWLEHTLGAVAAAPFNLMVASVTVVLAALAGALAYFIHSRTVRQEETADPLAGLMGRLYGVAQAGWGIDALYAQAIVEPYARLSALVSEGDGRLFETVHGVLTGLTGLAVDRARRLQSGQLQWNVAAIVIGLIVVLLVAGVAEMAGITDVVDMAAIANIVRK